MVENILLRLIPILLLTTSSLADHHQYPNVSYDKRSLIINGSRELLFSGSIHYPRTQPEMWPDLFAKAKLGGINVIQTYIFWNIHEPIYNQFHYQGNADIVKFLKTIHEHGLWVSLRVGPYIAAEWNQGGFPYWLREVPDIMFRSYNDPFMYHMKRFCQMFINIMKNEKLFLPQGGPIILLQIENEYGSVQASYRENGVKYVQWAAQMAVSLYNGVPWVMCKQPNAPPEVYYGGTNYGRVSSSFVTTRYYDEAPLDEFGLFREPKFGHLRDVHRALRLSKKALLWGERKIQKINQYVQTIVYEKPGDASMCAAFIINNKVKIPATVNFRGVDVYLPAKSISILPDCKTVVFNTQTVVAQHSARNFVTVNTDNNLDWEFYREPIPTFDTLPIKNIIPIELYFLTKDASDYAWYSTSVSFDRRDLPMRPDVLPILLVENNGHAMVAFLNGEFVGEHIHGLASVNINLMDAKIRAMFENILYLRYHIPRSLLNAQKNLVVVFEEVGGNPHNITILTRCLGKITCTIPLVRDAFVDRNKDTCSDTFKALAVQVKCGAGAAKL
ncbi:hypothetical protein AG4045_016362 [Apium graveolens]|uniref:beta-galactosidase n=1 Tax=Apium graveolens TaxID=4045 RepID=A0A6L5BBV3_APIGR|nr:hypothetical protein AG4045_016362 [Apium graveolens]